MALAQVFGGARRARGVSVAQLAGTVVTLAVNTLASQDPKNDAAANPNYPDKPPWEVGASVTWSTVGDYCGAVLAPGLGSQGRVLVYGGAGHSAVNACAWWALDIATGTWARQGYRPPPSDAWSTGYTAGSNPPTSRYNHTEGTWLGGSTDWDEAFRQTGYNPPSGGHTRANFCAIPASVSGNTDGAVLCAWGGTEVGSASNVMPSQVWDADTGLFAADGTHPSTGARCAGIAWSDDRSVAVGALIAIASTSRPLHIWQLGAGWTSYTLGGTSVSWQSDTSVFVVGDLVVYVQSPAVMYGCNFGAVMDASSGAAGSWAALTVTGDTFTGATGFAWAYCPDNGAFYGVPSAGGTTLYKLTPPSGTAADKLAGTWTISSQSLTSGSLTATVYDYGRLRWVAARKAFVWVPSGPSTYAQLVRPTDV